MDAIPKPVSSPSLPAAQKPLAVVPIAPPPVSQRVSRGAVFAGAGESRTRYSLPASLESGSPVGYRTRVPLTREEASQLMPLLSLARPTAFAPPTPVTEQALFEECSLGVLSSRQSTNYRGHRATVLGPDDSRTVATLLRAIDRREARVLDDAAYTHVVFTRPYRTPFTMLLTFIGHAPVASLATVAMRAWRKRFDHVDDIPTIGYLQQIHLGVLADAMERATVIASQGTRRAQLFLAPFDAPSPALRELEKLAGLTRAERAEGWRIGLVAQVGNAVASERVAIDPSVCRAFGANVMAFRSERIQPGVNAEESAPAAYQSRQTMDVPDDLTVMAGRAAYNAFAHWTGCDRQRSKHLLLLERIDVLTPNGKERLRAVRSELNRITDRILKGIPLWADLATGRALSRNTQRGRKAFALAGQRIYIGGLSRREIEREGIAWEHAVRAFGAAAARSALMAEIMGCVDLPAGCDLLAGVCLMAGPVNQNDIGKAFYGFSDLLDAAFPDRTPTSLLVWTLKAKTVADPIGNEEQLLNRARKGVLVDLRLAPHEGVFVRRGDAVAPMRKREGRTSTERAFSDANNFVTDPAGREIPGNRGSSWPDAWRHEAMWSR